MATADSMVSDTICKVLEELQRSMLNLELQKFAQEEILKPTTKITDIKKAVKEGLVKSGMDRQIQNFVFKCLQTIVKPAHPLASVEQAKEPISYIRKAQINWEKRILKSLNSMCTELSLPLAKMRSDKGQREMASKWTELGTDEPDLSDYRPVYAPKDFLDVIASVKHPNVQESGDPASPYTMWGIIQAQLQVKDIHQLRLQFSEMSISEMQSGIDDSPGGLSDQFENERIKLTKKALSVNSSVILQQLAKKGLPLTERAHAWSAMLGITLDDIDLLYYEQLKASVLRHDLLLDTLIYKDVKLTAANDDQYFVFEDYIYQILLPFARDTSVIENFRHSSASPPRSYLRGRLGVEEYCVNYPPSGVIPFHGFSMYVAPLCYIYNDVVTLYFVFRALYTRFFFRLHALSSHEQGIISLSLQFERLLQAQEPQLVYHLKQIGLYPLRVAFKWLVRAFSGYLASEQVLMLWDRIIAFNSLEILPVLAMSIFAFRKTNLMQVQNVTAAEAVLNDITTLKVIPLIQLALFSQS